MKQLIILILAGTVFIGCENKENKERISTLEENLEEAQTNLEERDSLLNDYLEFVTDVEENLNEIREREAMLSLKEDEFQDTEAHKDQMLRDLQTINTLMIENKEKMEVLNQNLRGSMSQNQQLKSLVNVLKKNVENKEFEVEKLNKQLAYLVDENQILKLQVDSLYTETSTREKTINEQSTRIDKLDNELNTAYYTSGPKKELLDKEIITREGGILGIGAVKQLNDNVSVDQLQNIDIRNTFSIPVQSRKVELVTDHPKESYEMITDEEENKIDKLVILDPDKFWSSSRCLVMVTR